jgi:hypothetical protein
MVLEDVFYEEVGQVRGGSVGSTWYEVPHLRQAVHYYPYSIVSVGPRETSDEIHANILPGSVGD